MNDRDRSQSTDRTDQPDDTVTIVGYSTPEFERNMADFRAWQAEQRQQRDRR